MEGLGVVLLDALAQEVGLAQHVVGPGMAGVPGQLFFVERDGAGGVLLNALAGKIEFAYLIPVTGVAALGGLGVPVEGLLVLLRLFQLIGVDGLMDGVTVLRANLPQVLRLLRLGGDDVLVALGVILIEVVGGKVDAAPEGLPEPVLALGDVLH